MWFSFNDVYSLLNKKNIFILNITRIVLQIAYSYELQYTFPIHKF